MEIKPGYLIGSIILIGGIIALFYRLDIGIIGITIAIVIALIQYILQKKGDAQRHDEYVHLASLIHDSADARKKIQSLKDLMKNKNIQVKKIIEKFDKPFYSIFIYKFNERPRGSPKDAPTPLKDQIEKTLKFKLISNSFYMLLPKDMPKINSSFDLEKWVEKNIISQIPKSATYTLNFVALVDLRKVFCYKTVEWGNTVFDMLTQDATFLGKLIEYLPRDKISPKEIIKDYGIGDIVTLKVDTSIIKSLNENSAIILENLSCQNLTNICDVPTANIENELLKHTGNNTKEISKNLIQNSKALKEIL